MKTAAWMLALTSLTCWNAMAQNLVSNPGFETGDEGNYTAGSTTLPGWIVDATPTDGVQLYTASSFGVGVTQTPNTKALQLTGASEYTGGGGVQQSIATTPGVTYTISIDVANRQSGSVTGNFSFGGQNQTLSASSQTFTILTWTVTASSAITLIDITGSTSSGSVQLLIDNVSVTSLPFPAVVAWGPAMNVTADTDVATNGVLQYAEHWGGSDQTINGVPFTAAGVNVTKSDGNSSIQTVSWTQGALSTAYYNLLCGNWYNANNATVTLNNLTSGKLYQVQMWSIDKRYGTGQLETYGGTPPVSLSIGTGQYAIGTFTATATTQNILATGDGPINAVVVRDLSAVDDYAAWSGPSGYNLAEGPAGDDDKDGLTNHEEYAFGLIPNSGTSVNPIAAQLDKATGKFSYTRRKTSIGTGLTYSVWFSENLVGWNQDTTPANIVVTPIPSSDNESVEITLSTFPGNPLPAKLFIQVRAN